MAYHGFQKKLVSSCPVNSPSSPRYKLTSYTMKGIYYYQLHSSLWRAISKLMLHVSKPMPCFGNETDCFGTLKGMKKYNFILHYSCKKEYLVRKENMPFEARKRASFISSKHDMGHGKTVVSKREMYILKRAF